MFLPWHRYYVQYFEDSLTTKCNYTGTTPYWDWTIGKYRQRGCAPRMSWRHDRAHRNYLHPDAHDMYNSPFFDKSPSGVGGWGDPANDYQINTGGFKDVIRAYPNPHRIRRNFTVQPFNSPDAVSPFPNDPAAPPIPREFMINTTMTKQNVDFSVNSFEGDFIGFQSYLESLSVSSILLSALSRPS